MRAHHRRHARLAVSAALLLLTGCTGPGSGIASLLPFLRGGTPIGNNRPPIIQSLQVPELAGIKAGGSLPLTVRAQDPDGDPLTVAWFCSRGTLASPMGDKTVWHPDATPGDYYVAAAVADGRGGATLQVRDLHVAADGTMSWGATRTEWPAGATPLPSQTPGGLPSVQPSVSGASPTPIPSASASVWPAGSPSPADVRPVSVGELVFTPYVVQASNPAVTATDIVRAPVATMGDIAAGPQGSLYVLDQTAGAVYRITNGTATRLPGTPGKTLTAIAVGPDGDVVVADLDSRRIVRLMDDGTVKPLLDQVSSVWTGALGIDGAGTVFASDSWRLYRVGREGTIRKSSFWWANGEVSLGPAVDGMVGNGGGCRVRDAKGRMVFAGNGRLFRLETDDSLTPIAGARGAMGVAINPKVSDSTIDPQTMAFTAAGAIYYHAGQRIYRIGPDDALRELPIRFEGLPDMSPLRWTPNRLAIGDGFLYVSESTNHIVWRAKLP